MCSYKDLYNRLLFTILPIHVYEPENAHKLMGFYMEVLY